MQVFKRIIKGMSFLFFVIAVFLLIVIFSSLRKNDYPNVFGYRLLVVVSDSMEETIMVNDAIIIKEHKDYYVDDIITFKGTIHGTPQLITHRIIAISDDGQTYICRGDKSINDPTYPENGELDDYVAYDDVLGKVITISPLLGKVLTSSILRNKTAIVGILSIMLLIITLILLKDVIALIKEKNK